MPKEIQFAHTMSGQTLYAHVWNPHGEIYSTVAVGFEAYLTANIANYDIPLTEQGTASRFYTANMPGVAADYLQVTIQAQSGGAPAESDAYVGSGEYFWNGSELYTFTDIATHATEVWAALLESGYDAGKILRIIAAAVAGKASGGPTSPVFRNLGDTQDQITGTADSSGNRTSAIYGP